MCIISSKSNIREWRPPFLIVEEKSALLVANKLTPSIAISQIALIPNTDNLYNYSDFNYFVVSSLKAKKIIFIKYFKKTEKIKILNEIYIGERIRDILVKDSNIYLALENSSSLFIIKIPNLD